MKRASFHTGLMKANPRRRPALSAFPQKLAFAPLAALAMVAGCVAPSSPPPAPRPAPAPVAPPAPTAPPAADWRDAPQTPGDWSIASPGIASFANGTFGIRCNRGSATVSLFRSGAANGSVPLSISTSDTSRVLTASPVNGGVQVDLPARDRLLDAMAFSRGRFAAEVQGMAPLYIPSWTEISRVIEDCR
ncbi:hypothetical protein ACLIMP_13320 [Novosphingobium aerophilum]|uniref:hypothetical protein n=1 Tax=Novosphingobium aerophilum TaxID=2839843 RepID=UPI003FD3ABE4